MLVGRPQPPLPFRPLSQRSGRISALPYPPLKCIHCNPHFCRRDVSQTLMPSLLVVEAEPVTDSSAGILLSRSTTVARFSCDSCACVIDAMNRTRLLQNSENRLPNGRGSQNSRSFDSLSELRASAVVLKLAATRYDYPLDVA